MDHHTARRRLLVVLSLAISVAALSGCTSSPSTPIAVPSVSPSESGAAAQPTGPETIVTGLNVPWSAVTVNDEVLIAERDTDRLFALDADRSLRELATVPGVEQSAEQGVMGLAFDGEAGLFVYSTGATGNRVQRFPVTQSGTGVALGEPVTVVDGLPSSIFHNGGRIGFGPDGMLYVSVGDVQEGSNAQDLDSLAGKILRYAPDGSIPTDNPFPGSPIYSYGHRNVQGIAWTEDGRMLSTEFVGDHAWDELNEIVPGGNYGWPEIEGTGGEARGFIDPLQTWAPAEASPSGIAIAGDTLFIANLRGETLRAVPLDDLTTSTTHFTGEFGRLRDVLLGPDDRLWFLTNNTDGRGTLREGDDRIIAIDLATVGASAAIGVAPAGTGDPSCTAAAVVTVRGTGEPLETGLLGPVATAISDALLGDVTVITLPYPASFAFEESLPSGRSLLRDTLVGQAEACPAQRTVVAGYSQGAVVVGDTLAEVFTDPEPGTPEAIAADNIAAVILYGDPRFLGTEPYNAGDFDPAVNGDSPRQPGELSVFADRIRNYCVASDFACQSGVGSDAGHVAYFQNGMREQGARFGLDRLAGAGVS
ncbi:PQQ-dependent sugar dehydrogenase [Microbacterium sp. NPDC077663]|uniref:PQQ-dependent sugar dehydrogenase n=1 Tax=Microbacterium sp. NPDC077663 TaxID=3364189 RepID=UPI0037C6C9F9